MLLQWVSVSGVCIVAVGDCVLLQWASVCIVIVGECVMLQWVTVYCYSG